MCGVLCTNGRTVSNFKLPTDKVQNRLMVSVHFYDPNEYTLDASIRVGAYRALPIRKLTGETKTM